MMPWPGAAGRVLIMRGRVEAERHWEAAKAKGPTLRNTPFNAKFGLGVLDEEDRKRRAMC
jgi:hypothetical protein